MDKEARANDWLDDWVYMDRCWGFIKQLASLCVCHASKREREHKGRATSGSGLPASRPSYWSICSPTHTHAPMGELWVFKGAITGDSLNSEHNAHR